VPNSPEGGRCPFHLGRTQPMTSALSYRDEVAGILPVSLCPQVRTLSSLPR
jgi:hypothetical protein